MFLEPHGICDASLSITVAYSWPRIFSVRSLSSRPPNHTSLPLGRVAYQSVLLIGALTFGKHSSITLGNVSRQIDCFTALNRKRSTACLDPLALIALATIE